MEKLTIKSESENISIDNGMKSSTPDVFIGYKIVKNYDSVILQLPVNGINENISINPSFQYTWSPEISPAYSYKDKCYHFTPVNSRIHVSLDIDDIISNLQANGATIT